jgi:hypothetical protein
MTLLDILQLGVTAIVAVWGIYNARVTRRLEQEVHYLNVGLDQSIQLLHRAREAVTGIHRARVAIMAYHYNKRESDDKYIQSQADESAYWAELRGLGFAINDVVLCNVLARVGSALEAAGGALGWWWPNRRRDFVE